ncbi:LysR family transcriptional regulator [Phototrophicus methaneseepsis]|uniref:LysR family transcriptional regulator n=1 Tax=Phototrophicus methaneseepsis TaxID=2710758 RepID=A0A7S8E540_9CHLR|nr:LysR family transcriptional regulator [Phototrophicus methaneseepsis]QPC80515.1 LysR family transcriptional regulator [Phototrophicus methaneseepsis]
MELRQLEYFVAIVETGSFSQAAQRCNVAQPSLSQQIMKLENELGQQLFDRLGRSIAVTEAGRLFYPRARSILSEVRQAKYVVTDGYMPAQGSLSVGIIPTLGPYLLYQTVQKFKQTYPDAELQIREDMTDNLVDKLLNAELDVAFVSLPIENKQIITEQLFVEPLYVAIPANHELANEAVIDISTLGHLPFIRLSDQNCLADQLDAFCYVQKIDPPTIYHTTQLTTVLEFVRLGIGVSLIPACSAALYEGGGLVFKRIAHNTLERTIVAARHHGRAESVLSRGFNHFLAEAWRQIVGETIAEQV